MFTEAALDIFNCHHVLFNHSLLQDNSGTGIVNASYRGNTGGVSFGYNTLPVNFSSPSLLVTDCVFRNNSARATSAFRTSSQAFFAQIFTGRGGSLALFVNESRYDLDVTIRNCTFTENTARSFGGGVYLLLGGFGTSHRVVVERARVISNVAQLGGGGFQASFFNNGPEDAPLMMRFDDCLFENNSGIAGGGIFVFTSTDGKCLFRNSLGGAFLVYSGTPLIQTPMGQKKVSILINEVSLFQGLFFVQETVVEKRCPLFGEVSSLYV